MKGDLCRHCRTDKVESKEGIYCKPCLTRIKRSGLVCRKAITGYWYDHQQGGVK